MLWAVGEVGAIIAAEVARLEAYRATLDPARVEKGRAEAAERSLLDLGKEGTALRRYAGAAERAVFKAIGEIRVRRAEIATRAAEPGAMTEVLATATTTQTPHLTEFAGKSASFCPAPGPLPSPRPGGAAGSILDELGSAYVPIAAGRSPRRRGRTRA